MTRVLVHGDGPALPGLLARLTEEGAQVHVPADGRTARLDDLVARGWATYATDPDPWAFDVVHRVGPAPASPAPEADTAERGASSEPRGRVLLVGGGPGDPGLLTLRGLEAVRTADVLVCDRLAPLSVLAEARPDAEIVHVGKIPRGESTPQEAIDALLVERALAGRTVVRLKGGDGFLFGRGGEEWLACTAAGVPVEVVPGISSALAAPALADVPVTHRGTSQGVAVVSGHVPPGDPRSQVDWSALGSSGLTLVVLMGLQNLPAIGSTLRGAGLAPTTPVAMVANGSTPAQRTVRATLADAAERAASEGLHAPVTIVIGQVVDALVAP
ncbi:uroporphyrinogen-III C-methyltransferase [Kytococcus sp. Marseille-QA3725]